MENQTIVLGNLLWPDGEIRPGFVMATGSSIAAVEPLASLQALPEGLPQSAMLLRAPQDGIVSPGLIDLQVNGAYGFDFTNQPESMANVAHRLPERGVTSFLPTIITAPAASYAVAVQAAHELHGTFTGARVAGLHFEGPYFNPLRKGAHPPHLVRTPQPADLEHMDASIVRVVTLAPEVPGALALIRELALRGITVSLGHSDATYAEVQQALEAGATWSVHLFNAMRPLHHREPGIIGALLTDPRVRVGLIPDGIHVHPALLKMTVALKGVGGVTLTSDAASAAGMPPGEYDLGGQRVQVDGLSVRLADGTLAGSGILLDQAVRTMVQQAGCSPAQALYMATFTPAIAAGLPHTGQLIPGYDADLTIWTADLQPAATLVAGQVVYQREEMKI